MANVTVENGLYTPELWAKELNRLMMDSGVMLDCVNTKYEGLIKNEGDKVHIQTPGQVTIGNYGSEAIDYQLLDGDTQTLDIDQKKYWGFHIPDIEKVQANVDFASAYIQNAKKGLVNAQDAFLLSKAADADLNNQIGAVTLTKDNVYSKIVEVRTRLRLTNAIDDSGLDGTNKHPWLVVDPKIMGIILQAPEFIHATNLGDNTLRKGAIGRIAGVDIKESTVLKAVDGATTLLGGTTEAITFAQQIIKVETLKDKDRFGDYIRGLYVYGAKTVNPQALVTMQATIG